jgi:ribosomal protein S18 acetylase RimI-like enzyme
MLKIRRYQPQDNKIVKELHYAGLAQFGVAADPYHDRDLDDIEGVYINNDGDFLVGTDGGEIMAIGAIKKKSSTCAEIKRIRVRRDYQRRGYARTILSRLMELAREMGYTEIVLDATVDNTPARRLFENCGFKETHYGKVGVYDLVFYVKKLNEGSD